MLRFPAALPKIKFDRIDVCSLSHSDNLYDTFPIHSIHFLVPGSNTHKQKFEEKLASDENVYFIIKDVTAKSLIEKSFLEHFVKSGSLLATSHNARIEVENFLAITSQGKLILCLEKSIAHCLALQKENPSKKKKERKAFETIVIDIACPAFSPGKKFYEFIAFELSKIEHIKFTLLLKWKPLQGDICPQSIKAYFESQNIECFACKPNQEYSFKSSVPAPALSSNVLDVNVHDVLEWIGMQLCGVEYSDPKDEYISKCFVPEPFETLERLHKYSFEGFYSKTDVLHVSKEIREIFKMDSTLPFIVMCLSGFQDSYVATSGFEHFSSADKLICIVTFPSSDCWQITLNAK